jgi:hypothetical protein
MENPGETELKRIIKCMKDYEYDETSLERGEFDYYKFNLTNRPDGSNDHTIKVTIEFSTDFDKNKYEKDDNNNVIDNEKNKKKADQFIKKLKTDTSTKKGGQKKKQRKTKKNKK